MYKTAFVLSGLLLCICLAYGPPASVQLLQSIENSNQPPEAYRSHIKSQAHRPACCLLVSIQRAITTELKLPKAWCFPFFCAKKVKWIDA